jgi:uncharacterized protein YndB with AHSA1/START domain
MTTVAITRIFAAPPERVWTALTDVEALAAWFWPAQLETTVTADVRVGGAYRIESIGADMAISGHYREISAPERLVMSWRWDGEDEESVVTIDLSPNGTGTELRLAHDRLPDDRAGELHAEGWNDCLDRLPAWL